jgi:leucine dehydrogenase
VDALGGRFIAGEDVGIEAADLRAMGTRWMTPSPDSAEAAAEGVLACLKRAVRERLRRDDLDGLRVAVQGVGRVGGGLARRLSAEGARLVLADLDAARAAGLARELSATAVPAEKIFDAEVDVFAPCALGGAVDSARLRCAVICGGANNQLVRPSLAEELAAKNILYVPDFVANAGGILGAGAARLGDVLDGVFHRAARDGITPLAAAERIARERFRAMGGEL